MTKLGHTVSRIQIAEETTYREVALPYPCMRYQIGRACAAAGYSHLYRGLDLFPDVSIAEEAREGNTEGIIKYKTSPSPLL